MSLRSLLASEHSVDSCLGPASRVGGQGQPWKGYSVSPLHNLDGDKSQLTSLPSYLTNGPHCFIERSRDQLQNMMERGLDSLGMNLINYHMGTLSTHPSIQPSILSTCICWVFTQEAEKVYRDSHIGQTLPSRNSVWWRRMKCSVLCTCAAIVSSRAFSRGPVPAGNEHLQRKFSLRLRFGR